MIAKQFVESTGKGVRLNLNMIKSIEFNDTEEHDNLQQVWTNQTLPDL